MNLHIKPLSAENKKEALQLNVKTEQSSFIEPVSQCIQEAEQLDLWNPVAIYHGTDMIGFAMYGFFPYEDTHGRVWLDRFLIDDRYQGKGYGKTALKLLITRLFCEYQCNAIYLSLYQQNKHAYHLYTSFGFQENGEKDINGETVMCLQKNHESVRQLNEIFG